MGVWNWVILRIRLIEVLKTSKVLLLTWRLVTRVCAPGDKRTLGGTLSRVRLAVECDPDLDHSHRLRIGREQQAGFSP